jgi:diaminopimelate decarboxylase
VATGYVVATGSSIISYTQDGNNWSNVTNINYWSELIDKIFELLYQIKISGYEIQFINLGGGIGIDYKTGVPIDTKSLCKIIMERLVFNSTKYNLYL